MSVVIDVRYDQAPPETRQLLQPAVTRDLGKHLPVIVKYPDRHPISRQYEIGLPIPVDIGKYRRVQHPRMRQRRTYLRRYIEKPPVIVPQNIARRPLRIRAQRYPPA